MTPPKKSAPQFPDDNAPSDVGSQLKRRRTLRGQSVEAVHQQTRIPKEYLEALEANHFEHFPATVYMRGFLRSYAEYLDLDSDALLASAENASPATPGPKHLRPLGDAQRGKPFWLPVSESTLIPVMLLGGLVLAGGLLWALKERQPSAQELRAAPVSEAAAPSQEITVEIAAIETTTFELTSLGEAVFEGRLPAGHTTSFKGRDFAIKTPHPDHLRISIGGAPVVWSDLPEAAYGAKVLTLPSP